MRILLVALFVISSVWLGCKTEPVVPVTIHTSMGAIDVVIDTVAAPRTSANFLRYASEGFYDGGSFRRVVRMDNQPGDSIRIEAVQAWANMELSDLLEDLIARGMKAGYADEHLTSLVKILRQGAQG